MLTITVIEGGIGGHTEPSAEMLEVAREALAKANKERIHRRT